MSKYSVYCDETTDCKFSLFKRFIWYYINELSKIHNKSFDPWLLINWKQRTKKCVACIDWIVEWSDKSEGLIMQPLSFDMFVNNLFKFSKVMPSVELC